jgi:hypothetical protein
MWKNRYFHGSTVAFRRKLELVKNVYDRHLSVPGKFELKIGNVRAILRAFLFLGPVMSFGVIYLCNEPTQFNPEDGGSMFLRNICICPRNHIPEARALLVYGFVDYSADLNIGRKICRELTCLVQASPEDLRQVASV